MIMASPSRRRNERSSSHNVQATSSPVRSLASGLIQAAGAFTTTRGFAHGSFGQDTELSVSSSPSESSACADNGAAAPASKKAAAASVTRGVSVGELTEQQRMLVHADPRSCNPDRSAHGKQRPNGMPG